MTVNSIQSYSNEFEIIYIYFSSAKIKFKVLFHVLNFQARNQISLSRKRISKALNCSCDEIIFTSGTFLSFI